MRRGEVAHAVAVRAADELPGHAGHPKVIDGALCPN